MLQLVTAERMRELDRRAVQSGISSLILMENAGRALAHRASELLEHRPSDIAVLAGPGQNGGDGLVAARHLSAMGHRVKVGLFGASENLPQEASLNLGMLSVCPVQVLCASKTPPQEVLAWLGEPHLIVDALLGIGLKGDPRPPISVAIEWINSAEAPVVACDIPSGLDADTGFPYTPTVKAGLTVTMGLPKVGMYSYPGRSYCGTIVTESLSLPSTFFHNASLTKAVFLEDAREHMPRRASDHHKGMSGRVTVVAGSLGMAGASVLAAIGALRGGAGTVTLFCPGRVYEVCASMAPEIMVIPVGDGATMKPGDEQISLVREHMSKSSAVVLGPGLGRGESQTAFVARVLKSLTVPCVLDADGLFALGHLGGLTYLAGLAGKFILTPHPKELADLMGCSVRDLAADRMGHAMKASHEAKAVVCLKGAGTCVANYTGEGLVNTSGDPAMATGGAGDVLAGVIAALIGQGLSLWEAAWVGVFWHGLAGEIARDKQGSYGVLAGDIAQCLPEARRLITGR
ncbi:MAG: NAD(P)H-hydrate dehydratase [Bacillota bacterium]|jgi:hydroxyethylthiazole kinase-like uncharacterized protein yjeF